VFIDIKGAFNKVKKGNLYKVLRDKGLPKNIVKWIVDFISSRTITLKRGGILGTPFKLDNGLP
jgi:Reverse transcriptase (RNA-dependent DNA polymerase)